MATYNNTVPAVLKTGDIVYFNYNSTAAYNGSFTFPKGQYKIAAYGGKGGDSGGATGTAVFRVPGYYEVGSRWTVRGGSGGYGGCATAEYTYGSSFTLGVACGAKANPSRDTGSTSGGSGGGGSGAVVTVNGSKILQGGGGGGATPGGTLIYTTYERIGDGGSGYSVSSTVWGTVSSAANGSAGGGVGGAFGAAGYNYATGANKTAAGSGAAAAFVAVTALMINSPPSVPSPVSFGKPNAGKALEVTCGTSVDAEGDAITYVFEHRTDNNAFTTCGTSSTPNITAIVPTTGTIYTARAKAVDIHGAESDYALSTSQAINYNNVPTISGEDGSKDQVTDPFAYEFSVDDEDPDDRLTVSILLDGALQETIAQAVRNRLYSFDLADQWLFTDNGLHVLKIVAEDDKGGRAERKITFERITTGLHLMLVNPVETETVCPTVYPFIFHSAPPEAVRAFRLCNNAFDEAPAWEDVTAFDGSSSQGGIYTFQNTQKTADKWGVGIEIIIEKPQGYAGKIMFSEALLLLYANGNDSAQYASNIITNAAAFSGMLSPADNTVQKALETLDQNAGTGSGTAVLSYYPTLSALNTAHITGEKGDCYGVGMTAPYEIYTWDVIKNEWFSLGQVQGVVGQTGSAGPMGPQGPQGSEGKQGEQGETGGLVLLDQFPTLSALELARPAGSPGDAYAVGEEVYIWSEESGGWLSIGSLKGNTEVLTGTNENGTYYTAGALQICMHTITDASAGYEEPWTYPRAFASPPFVTVSFGGEYQTHSIHNMQSITNTQAVLLFDNVGVDSDWVQLIAVGTPDLTSDDGMNLTFPPSEHTQNIATINGLQEELDKLQQVISAGVDAALPLTGSTMTGNLITNNPTPDTVASRNIFAGTDDMTAGTSALPTGVIYFVYE